MSFVTKTEWGHFPEEIIYLEGARAHWSWGQISGSG